MKQGYRRWKEILSEDPPTNEPLRVATAPSSTTSGMAIASLVLGIVAFIVGALTGIPAIICGHLSLRRISNSGDTIKGEGLAIAGLVAGYVGTILGILAIIYFTVILPEEQKELAEERDKAMQELIRVPAEMISKILPRPSQSFRPIRPPSLPYPPVMRKRQYPSVAKKVDFTEQIRKNEAAVAAILGELVSAQQVYHRQNGRYAGSVKSLALSQIKANEYSGYNLKILALSSSFRITAQPTIPGQSGVLSFFVDDSGVIRSNPGGKAGKEDPALNLRNQ